MIAKILYSKGSPSEHEAEGFVNQLTELKVESQMIEADSQEGAALTELYDLMSRPAVVLVRADGSMVERWLHSLPLATDVSYLAHQ